MTDGPEKKKVSLVRHTITEFWRLALLLTGFATLYSLIINVVNGVAMLVTGVPVGMPKSAALMEPAVATPIVGVAVGLPEGVAEVAIACIILGIITYVILEWLCQQEWVQEPVQIEKCWEEVQWYNPWSWVVAIVCALVWGLAWVLKTICGWVEVVVIVLVLACIIVGIIIIAA